MNPYQKDPKSFEISSGITTDHGSNAFLTMFSQMVALRLTCQHLQIGQSVRRIFTYPVQTLLSESVIIDKGLAMSEADQKVEFAPLVCVQAARAAGYQKSVPAPLE